MTGTAEARDLVLFMESTAGAHSMMLVEPPDDRIQRVEWSRQQSRQDNVDDLCELVVGDRFGALGVIVVDVGPGNLATTRACVSYANALAFAFDLRVGSLDSLEVMTWIDQPDADGVAAVRRAGPHGFYVRYQRGGAVGYALLEAADAADQLAGLRILCSGDQDRDALDLAGVSAGSVHTVAPTVDAMATLWREGSPREVQRSAEPLNESGELFRAT